MTHFFKRFLTGKDTAINGIFALGFIAAVALGCTCGKGLDLGNTAKDADNTATSPSDNGMPGDELVKALVNETTADFALAVSTGDFSKIHNKASMDFQRTVSLERLQSEFKPFVDRKRTYLPSLSKVSSTAPEFSPPPSIRQEKGLDILIASGEYDTSPIPVKFDYEYVKRDGRWKLLKLIVKM